MTTYDTYDLFIDNADEDTLVELWNNYVEECQDDYYSSLIHYQYELEDYFNNLCELMSPWEVANSYTDKERDDLQTADYFYEDEIYGLRPIWDVAPWIKRNDSKEWRKWLKGKGYILSIYDPDDMEGEN